MSEHIPRTGWRKKILIAAAVLAVTAVLLLSFIGVFRITEVTVIGNEFYTREEIADLIVGEGYQRNTFYLYLRFRYQKHPEIPFIDDFEVSLDSFQSITIRVYEKNIVGYVHYLGKNVYFDKDGFVVEISKRQIAHVPKVDGIECRKVVVYEKLNLNDEQALSLLLIFSQQLAKYELVPKTIAFYEDRTLSADFGSIQAEIGDDEYLVEKVMRLDAIMPKLSGKKGTLHLENWTPLTTDIIFEPD